jgi:pseudo-rSAM protein
MNEDDITGTIPALQELHLKSEVNVHEINSLTMLSDGTIYSNINGPKIGHIKSFDMSMLPYRNKNWGNVRNKSNNCKECLYNLICPSISSYEYAFGRDNLCNVKL